MDLMMIIMIQLMSNLTLHANTDEYGTLTVSIDIVTPVDEFLQCPFMWVFILQYITWKSRQMLDLHKYLRVG